MQTISNPVLNITKICLLFNIVHNRCNECNNICVKLVPVYSDLDRQRLGTNHPSVWYHYSIRYRKCWDVPYEETLMRSDLLCCLWPLGDRQVGTVSTGHCTKHHCLLCINTFDHFPRIQRFNNSAADDFWKHCDEWRKCSKRAFYPFATLLTFSFQ